MPAHRVRGFHSELGRPAFRRPVPGRFLTGADQIIESGLGFGRSSQSSNIPIQGATGGFLSRSRGSVGIDGVKPEQGRNIV